MLRSFQLFRKIGVLAGNEITTVQKRLFNRFEFYEEMPKSKEYLSSEDSDSSVEKAPKRKREKEEKSSKDKAEKEETAESSKKLKSSSKDKEDETSWEIGNNRVVSVREFKGKLLIDIREMYMDNHGELKPGKKGIALSTLQWQKFMDCVEQVNKAVKKKC